MLLSNSCIPFCLLLPFSSWIWISVCFWICNLWISVRPCVAWSYVYQCSWHCLTCPYSYCTDESKDILMIGWRTIGEALRCCAPDHWWQASTSGSPNGNQKHKILISRNDGEISVVAEHVCTGIPSIGDLAPSLTSKGSSAYSILQSWRPVVESRL